MRHCILGPQACDAWKKEAEEAGERASAAGAECELAREQRDALELRVKKLQEELERLHTGPEAQALPAAPDLEALSLSTLYSLQKQLRVHLEQVDKVSSPEGREYGVRPSRKPGASLILMEVCWKMRRECPHGEQGSSGRGQCPLPVLLTKLSHVPCPQCVLWFSIFRSGQDTGACWSLGVACLLEAEGIKSPSIVSPLACPLSLTGFSWVPRVRSQMKRGIASVPTKALTDRSCHPAALAPGRQSQDSRWSWELNCSHWPIGSSS